jgi:hypothetical protein
MYCFTRPAQRAGRLSNVQQIQPGFKLPNITAKTTAKLKCINLGKMLIGEIVHKMV